MPLSPKELKLREASRDLGAELLESVDDMLAGRASATHKIAVPSALEARQKTGLSQQQFANILHISKRTLQEWEQGRRAPSGAARTLLMVAAKNPQALLEVA